MGWWRFSLGSYLYKQCGYSFGIVLLWSCCEGFNRVVLCNYTGDLDTFLTVCLQPHSAILIWFLRGIWLLVFLLTIQLGSFNLKQMFSLSSADKMSSFTKKQTPAQLHAVYSYSHVKFDRFLLDYSDHLNITDLYYCVYTFSNVSNHTNTDKHVKYLAQTLYLRVHARVHPHFKDIIKTNISKNGAQ